MRLRRSSIRLRRCVVAFLILIAAFLILIKLLFGTEPIRLVVLGSLLSDKSELLNVIHLMKSIQSRTSSNYLQLNVICSLEDITYYTVPLQKLVESYESEQKKLEVFFHNIQEIADKLRPGIEGMRQHFGAADKNDRMFTEDVFFLRPFYHIIFPYQKVIALDADLEFHTDIASLYEIFQSMKDTEMMAMTYDLAPHYRKAFSWYREKNPGTAVGAPSPGFQGFNTGVLLMDLEKLRANSKYTTYLQNLSGLATEFKLTPALADQDFFTVLGAKEGAWFHLLNCGWNFQLDERQKDLDNSALFDLYHRCNDVPKIYHANGGSSFPDRL